MSSSRTPYHVDMWLRQKDARSLLCLSSYQREERTSVSFAPSCSFLFSAAAADSKAKMLVSTGKVFPMWTH